MVGDHDPMETSLEKVRTHHHRISETATLQCRNGVSITIVVEPTNLAAEIIVSEIGEILPKDKSEA